VQKLSPVMKGLVETRARADGQCNKLARLIESLSADFQRVRAERDACDLLIAKINSRIRPDQIEPINAHQGRYGPRGSLRGTLIALIRSEHPGSITTTELVALLSATFQRDFPTASQRKAWIKGSIKPALRDLVREGLVNRLHDPTVTDGMPGVWQWVPPKQPTGSLAQLAAAAGLPIVTETAPLDDEPTSSDDNLPR